MDSSQAPDPMEVETDSQDSGQHMETCYNVPGYSVTFASTWRRPQPTFKKITIGKTLKGRSLEWSEAAGLQEVSAEEGNLMAIGVTFPPATDFTSVPKPYIKNSFQDVGEQSGLTMVFVEVSTPDAKKFYNLFEESGKLPEARRNPNLEQVFFFPEIDIRQHAVRDHIEKGDAAITHIAGTDNPPDILTKPLPLFKFEELRAKMGIMSFEEAKEKCGD